MGGVQGIGFRGNKSPGCLERTLTGSLDPFDHL